MVGRVENINQDKLTNSWSIVRDEHVQHKHIYIYIYTILLVPFVMLSFIIVFTRFHLYLKTFAFQQQSDTQTRKFIYKSPTRNPK